MKLVNECWLVLLEAFNALTGTPRDGSQQSLEAGGWPGHEDVSHVPHIHDTFPPENDPRVFLPPSHGRNGRNKFKCDYRAMGKGWRSCSTPEDRGCWLEGPQGTKKFDIGTDYEKYAPIGVTRKYVLEVANMTINADGVPNIWGKVFNQQYPGPWIEACWGDELEITVRNRLPYNGTAIHWHGIRMLNTTEMDGVNAVSQCPIAPGEEFTYTFKTWQYGTSWYHSHYSLQYGDGLLGPLTIHGPATATYDEPVDPILMTDWNHRSAFMDFQVELEGDSPKMDSILLNGKGSYAAIGNGGNKYKLSFEYGKKYLLRLINTSVDTTFVFAIDNHNLTVITSDFVPIHPYSVDHILIGIGQRYHVIVEARPHNKTNDILPDEDKAYWIRTIAAKECHHFMCGGIPDERQGIVNYRNNSEAIPTTERGAFSTECRDEAYENLVPYHAWNITKPNSQGKHDLKKPFEVGVVEPQPGKPNATDKFHRWSMGKAPMFLDFGEPTILHLTENATTFNDSKVVIEYNQNTWVYMVIIGMYADEKQKQDTSRKFYVAAHPMHLHGHDFALLQQSSENYTDQNYHPNFVNPPRRDVVLLPAHGFIAIAFKADNPGAWAFHCHIAWHASSGLAIQVLERAKDAQALLDARPDKMAQINKTCESWRKWYGDKTNFWDPDHDKIGFQDDSGV